MNGWKERYRGPLIAGLYECLDCGAAVFNRAKHDLEHSGHHRGVR